VAAANVVLAWLACHGVERVPRRHLLTVLHHRFASSHALRPALDELVRHGYLRLDPTPVARPAGGRSSEVYLAHSRRRRSHAGRAGPDAAAQPAD